MADKPTTLTRAQMEEAVKRGGSVIYQGRHILDVADLPSEAELAAGDAAREQQARDNLLEQKRLIEAQLVRMDAQSHGQATALVVDFDECSHQGPGSLPDPAAQIPGDNAQRTLRRGQPDALRWLDRECLEPLE